MDLTGRQGIDPVIEVDVIPETFVLCEVRKFGSLVCTVGSTKVDLRPKLLGAKSQMETNQGLEGRHLRHQHVASPTRLLRLWIRMEYDVEHLSDPYILRFSLEGIYSVESAPFNFCLGSQ